MGLITSAREKDSTTGTPTRNLQPIDYQGPSKPAKAGMTSSSENKQEAVAVRLGALSTKTKFLLITCSVIKRNYHIDARE